MFENFWNLVIQLSKGRGKIRCLKVVESWFRVTIFMGKMRCYKNGHAVCL